MKVGEAFAAVSRNIKNECVINKLFLHEDSATLSGLRRITYYIYYNYYIAPNFVPRLLTKCNAAKRSGSNDK